MAFLTPSDSMCSQADEARGLTNELTVAAESADAIVTIEEDQPGLSRIQIEGEPALLATIAHDLGIEYLQNAASMLRGAIALNTEEHLTDLTKLKSQ